MIQQRLVLLGFKLLFAALVPDNFYSIFPSTPNTTFAVHALKLSLTRVSPEAILEGDRLPRVLEEGPRSGRLGLGSGGGTVVANNVGALQTQAQRHLQELQEQGRMAATAARVDEVGENYGGEAGAVVVDDAQEPPGRGEQQGAAPVVQPERRQHQHRAQYLHNHGDRAAPAPQNTGAVRTAPGPTTNQLRYNEGRGEEEQARNARASRELRDILGIPEQPPPVGGFGRELLQPGERRRASASRQHVQPVHRGRPTP
ncbi:unnamed protein product [Amoebophrya sp. A120]|nr:unnamed protein product [Amoebophrya sp. A120]|eukprot:GSA120T00022371001.1